MIDLYSDNRDGNPYAYYEEDMSIKPTYHSGEESSRQEPRTPMKIRLERVRSFQLSHRTYKLVVMRDDCELVVNDRATEACIPSTTLRSPRLLRKTKIPGNNTTEGTALDTGTLYPGHVRRMA